jgi:hypothetical protein
VAKTATIAAGVHAADPAGSFGRPAGGGAAGHEPRALEAMVSSIAAAAPDVLELHELTTVEQVERLRSQKPQFWDHFCRPLMPWYLAETEVRSRPRIQSADRTINY